MPDFVHQRQELPAAHGGQVVIPLDTGTAATTAAANLGTKVQRLGELLDERLRNARNLADRRKLLAKAKLEYNDWLAARSLETDKFSTLRTDAQAKLKEISERQLATVEDGELRATAGADLAGLEASELDAVNSLARKQAADYATAALNDTTRSNRLLAANARDPADFEEAMRQGLGAIDDLEGTGLIGKTDADKRRNNFRSAVAEDQVRMMIVGDPTGAIRVLGNTNAFPDMDPGTRNQLMTLAIRQRRAAIAEEDRRARAAEAKDNRDRTHRHDTNFARALVAIERHQVTTEQLQAMVDEDGISGSQFNTASAKLIAWSADPPGDPTVERELTLEAHRGTLTLDKLYAAMTDQDVSLKQGAIIEQIVQEDSFTRTDAYRVARDALDRTFGIVPGGATPLQRQDAELSARAMRELYTRVKEGADPLDVVFGSPKEIGMIERYRQTRSQKHVVEAPRYPTREEADRAFERGDLSRTQYANEIERHELGANPINKQVGSNRQ